MSEQAIRIVIEGSFWELLGKAIIGLAGLGCVALIIYLIVLFIVFGWG